MRITISLFLLVSTLFSFSQRVTFEDPDLTFSFKKPKNWEVFDDGYLVKVSPSSKDSADIYFTITYFENAQPFGELPSAERADKTKDADFTETKIDGVIAKQREKMNGEYILHAYSFMKYGQRFEIKTSTQGANNGRIIRRIIRSIQIKK
ncbi:hypothetical protein [Ekhidna sp. To15]|uniref:hypothetical protein n=1 Tax=Ekhidna sp. To15 TaxID=3395267 RepID=UPI003F520474